jgi:hypothetical protein
MPDTEFERGYKNAIMDVLYLRNSVKNSATGALIAIPRRLWPWLPEFSEIFSHTPAPTETGGPRSDDRPAAPRGCGPDCARCHLFRAM